MKREKPIYLSKKHLLWPELMYQETMVFDAPYETTPLFSGLYAHEITEISVVVRGSGVHHILNQAIPCKAGDAYVVHANTPHGYFAASKEEPVEVRRLWFCVPDWFEGPVATYGAPRFCYGVFSDGAMAAYAMLTQQRQEEILGFMDRIDREIKEKKPEWKEAIEAHLTMLLICMSRYVGDAIKSLPSMPDKEWKLVSCAMEQVAEKFCDPNLTLAHIAENLFISQSYLSRLFKRATGEFFSDYLRNIRVNYACELLKNTELTVEEIIPRCGLRDVSSFYQLFHACTGMTPRQYRKEAGVIVPKSIQEKGDKIMVLLSEISELLQKGRGKQVQDMVQQAVDEGANVDQILNEGLLAGMSIVGEKFKNNEVFVPDVLVAARAMNMGAQVLKPYLAQQDIGAKGKVCIGTVQGDLHDIGKNLVKMMMEGKGLEVIDLGTDVTPEAYVKAAVENDCNVICCSALLTTTMGVMEDVVKEVEKAGIRNKVKIMIGGAPVSEEFRKKIGADVYTEDAASAAEAAVKLCQ